ncbi:MAG TPA: VTT domain-containing protein [Verrucomicrobia bacterium]|nr:VTT domain-containing protein [Verrucomicrobiota bacterium]HOB31894.1 VTT domain-containing protein [Verrucomicrobiota bacterium]HOP97194.1 VTT domain-containing protein [Verrucomicrobiota bacterium]HPU55199.1 VTT domain-containing protein [Verrucomicrobiota bacterium]
MSRFWIFTIALVLAMLLLFALLQAFQVPFLQDDTRFMFEMEKGFAALAGLGLLLVDVVAPVPSSVIMTANGALFGAVPGTLLSLAGGMGAAAVAYWIGMGGERAGRRWMGESALTRAHAFFLRHGMLAVIVSRPVPILAEAVGIIAGMAGMPRGRFFGGALAGLVPIAVVYAVAGAYSRDVNSGLYVFVGVMALAGAFWMLGRRTTGPDHATPR